MGPRLEIIETRLDAMSLRQEDVVRLLERVLAAQETEVQDRRTRRGEILQLLEAAGAGMSRILLAALTPGIVVPISVVVALALALAYGASVTYGDLVVDAARSAMDGTP